jgi:hypothetical protein
MAAQFGKLGLPSLAAGWSEVVANVTTAINDRIEIEGAPARLCVHPLRLQLQRWEGVVSKEGVEVTVELTPHSELQRDATYISTLKLGDAFQVSDVGRMDRYGKKNMCLPDGAGQTLRVLCICQTKLSHSL